MKAGFSLDRRKVEVQIAPGVHIYTATHPVEAQVRRSGLEYALPVSIQDGVWLSCEASRTENP